MWVRPHCVLTRSTASDRYKHALEMVRRLNANRAKQVESEIAHSKKN